MVVVPKESIEEPLERIGPMVAVYLDQPSVKKLQEKYPETAVARLRKVVIQYDPSDKQRGSYEPHFGGLATVQVLVQCCYCFVLRFASAAVRVPAIVLPALAAILTVYWCIKK